MIESCDWLTWLGWMATRFNPTFSSTLFWQRHSKNRAGGINISPLLGLSHPNNSTEFDALNMRRSSSTGISMWFCISNNASFHLAKSRCFCSLRQVSSRQTEIGFKSNNPLWMNRIFHLLYTFKHERLTSGKLGLSTLELLSCTPPPLLFTL